MGETLAASAEDLASNDAAGFAETSATNETEGPVNTAPTGLPVISGTARVGETLTASKEGIADADGLEGVEFAWQWLSDDGSGAEAIEGATEASYTLTAAEVGGTVRVRVTFTDEAGGEETVLSEATAAVPADTRPVATTLAVGGAEADPERFQVRVAFAAAVTGLAVDELSASQVGGDAVAVSDLAVAEAGVAWTASVATGGAGRYVVRLAAGAAEAGARSSTVAVLAVDVDADGNAVAVAGPAVTAVSLGPESDGSWTDGDAVRVTLAFTEPVTVATADGTPSVGIALGGNARQAAYSEGSDTASLVFAYTVTADDGTVNAVSVTADSLAVNGGTIRDAAGRDAALEHPGVGEADEEEAPEPVTTIAPLSGFALVDVAAVMVVGRLADGDEITLDDPAGGSFGVLVATAMDAVVGSMGLELSGAKTASRTVNAAPWSLFGDDGGTVLGEAMPAGSYTLTATAYAERDAGGAVVQTLTVSFTVLASVPAPVDPEALTAKFQDVPAAHGGPGSAPFTFQVLFSEDPAVSYLVLRDQGAFAVTGGSVRQARRVDGRDDLREIHVEPSGWDDVAVTLAGGRACGTTGAICTSDNKVLANTLTATIQGPLAISAADASVTEAANATLDFKVSLNRMALGPVTVAYTTADGTATAGQDYTAKSGTLTFAAGETRKLVRVAVLDDAHDDGAETLTLTLSDATGGARIRGAQATGTIENTDPLPRAWMARFGRAAAGHVLDAVAERLHGTGAGPSQTTIAGHRLTEAAGADPASDPETWEQALGQWLEEGRVSGQARRMEFQELLAGSSFDVALPAAAAAEPTDALGAAMGVTDPGSDAGWTVWGRGAFSHFEGSDSDLNVDGDVATGTVGADYQDGLLLAGLALAYSSGQGSYRDAATGDAGSLHSSLLGVHPYLRVALHERLSAWGVAGYGVRGELRLERDGTATPIDTDLGLLMGAFGLDGTLLAAAHTGGLELAARADGLLLRVDTGAAPGLAAAEAEVSRWRLLLNASYRALPLFGGSLTPAVEVGGRYDDGDAETGAGLVVGGSLAYELPDWGLSLTASGQGLVVHEHEGLREWGAGGSVRFDPGAPGRGVAVQVAPSWGSAPASAAGLWSLPDASALAAGGPALAGGRLDAEVSYGLDALDGTALVIPYAGVALADVGARTWRLGARLNLQSSFDLSLEGTRSESSARGARALDQSLTLHGSLRF